MRRNVKISIERYRKKLELDRSACGINAHETIADKEKRKEKARKDPRFMIEYYFPHYAESPNAAFQLEFMQKVKRRKTFKGFCQWGRALAKSVVCDIFLPFWLWMNGELQYIVLISTSKERAAELLEDLQAELECNKRIIHDFGGQKVQGRWENGNFITQGGLRCKALGARQSVRGLRTKQQRPDLCLIDDLETQETIESPRRQNKTVQWIERSLIPTMDGKRRRFIQANNRFAPRMIQTVLQEKHPTWVVHEVNAYDPVSYKPVWHQKYHLNYFKEIEQDIGTLAALAEYNNQPHVEGEIFKNEQIQWGKSPRLSDYKILCGYWDAAYAGTSTADYNAVVIQGLYHDNFYVLGAFVKQCKMRAAISFMCDYQKRLPPSVSIHWLFEAQFWNDEVRRTIKEVEQAEGTLLHIVQVERPRQNKYDRILQMAGYYQNGRIFYDARLKASNDTQVGLAQLFGIQPGYKGHDDYPDAQKGGLDFLEKHIYSGTGRVFRSGRMNPVNVW